MKYTHWIEIPIIINFDPYKAEQPTWDYPGSPAHVVVGEVEVPDLQLDYEKYLPDDDDLAEIVMDAGEEEWEE